MSLPCREKNRKQYSLRNDVTLPSNYSSDFTIKRRTSTKVLINSKVMILAQSSEVLFKIRRFYSGRHFLVSEISDLEVYRVDTYSMIVDTLVVDVVSRNDNSRVT